MCDYSRAHICQCLTRLITLRPNSTVTITGNRLKTGRQFVHCVLHRARQLSSFGVKPGNVVAICAFNSDWYLEWLLAVAYVGGILAPLNYRWSYEETRLALEVIKPVLIIVDEACTWWSEVQNSTLSCPRWHPDFGSYSNKKSETCQDMGDMIWIKPASIKYCWAPQDVAILCFTSGTTGKPKGVMLSHTALVMQSLAKIAMVGYEEGDVYMHTAPMCHIGAISSGIAMLMAGGCHVLIPRFEGKLAIQAIDHSQVTSLIVVPAILIDLISLVRMDKSKNSGQSLKKILNGGGSLSEQLLEDAIRIFPEAKLLSAYGMTEACSSLTFMTLHDPAIKSPNGKHQKVSRDIFGVPAGGICVGKPAPHVELIINSEEDSHMGSIMTRGPHVMTHYWGQNINTLHNPSEQWFDTGDMGHIDNSGNLWLVGRRNGRIKSGGENVYPEEVELVLSQHPGVFAAVVVGVADARLGEMVIACVQIRDNWIWANSNHGETLSNSQGYLSSELLKQFCEQKNLTRFKIPKAFIVWRKSFPRTSTGKLKRDQVKREVRSRFEQSLSKL